MPRPKRFTKAYSCHHVMLRGNAGQLIFFDDRDRIRFCLILQKASEQYSFTIHTFCFMSNHVHFILEPTTAPLSVGVHAFAGRYAQYFNRRHKQRGHLFQDRFRSILIEDNDYLTRLVRYIHLNPIRAGLTEVPENYKWSSYRCFLGLDEITWLSQLRILKKFGTTHYEARQAFAKYTLKSTEAQFDIEIIRESNQIGIFGSEEFTKEINRAVVSSASKIQFIDLIIAMQAEFHFEPDELSSKSKEKHLVDMRSIIALAVQKVPGLYLQELGKHLNRDSSTLCRLARRGKESEELAAKTEKLLEAALLLAQRK